MSIPSHENDKNQSANMEKVNDQKLAEIRARQAALGITARMDEDIIDEFTDDLYFSGHNEPVIRVVDIRAGYFINTLNGQVIRKPSDITYSIMDARTNNIVVPAERVIELVTVKKVRKYSRITEYNKLSEKKKSKIIGVYDYEFHKHGAPLYFADDTLIFGADGFLICDNCILVKVAFEDVKAYQWKNIKNIKYIKENLIINDQKVANFSMLDTHEVSLFLKNTESKFIKSN